MTDRTSSEAVSAVDTRPVETMPDDHRGLVQRRLDQAAAREFASLDDIDAAYRRFGL